MTYTEPPPPADTAGKPAQSQLEFDVPAPAKKDWRDDVPSVAEITRRIRGLLEGQFKNVWVRGEISNFRKPVSGHGYFVLKDDKSQLRAVIFRGHLSKHRFKIQDGMEVLLHGSIGVYEVRGEYQIVCDQIEPMGVGALQMQFEQLKLKLHKEGLFDKAHKKPLPALPKHIGVVTSATGAAVRDILKVLSRRFPNRHITILPASVQGDKAAPEIVKALHLAQRWNYEKPDNPIEVLIVGRGGGSIEDLWPFNEEIVARAIYDCDIPIISSVGHEIDFTIADFVADLRAPTPSAAAEVVVPRKEELVYRVQTLQERAQAATQKKIEQYRLHIGHLSQRLTDPREKIKKLIEHFQTLEKRFISTMRHRLAFAKQRLQNQTQMLHSLSPLQVIGRGYSLTQTPEGKVIQSIRDTKVGATLEHRVSDGRLRSKVVEITQGSPA